MDITPAQLSVVKSSIKCRTSTYTDDSLWNSPTASWIRCRCFSFSAQSMCHCLQMATGVSSFCILWPTIHQRIEIWNHWGQKRVINGVLLMKTFHSAWFLFIAHVMHLVAGRVGSYQHALQRSDTGLRYPPPLQIMIDPPPNWTVRKKVADAYAVFRW